MMIDNAATKSLQDFATKVLENAGVDTKCGACMEVAFTSMTTNPHTCARRLDQGGVSEVLAAALRVFAKRLEYYEKDSISCGFYSDSTPLELEGDAGGLTVGDLRKASLALNTFQKSNLRNIDVYRAFSKEVSSLGSMLEKSYRIRDSEVKELRAEILDLRRELAESERRCDELSEDLQQAERHYQQRDEELEKLDDLVEELGFEKKKGVDYALRTLNQVRLNTVKALNETELLAHERGKRLTRFYEVIRHHLGDPKGPSTDDWVEVIANHGMMKERVRKALL